MTWRDDQWDGTAELLSERPPYWLRPPKPPKLLEPVRPSRRQDRVTLDMFEGSDG